MMSNRTANFKVKEDSEINSENELIQKQFTTPLPKLDFNCKFLDENDKDKENSNFSFKHDLLSRRAYTFLKGKDESLSNMILDDTIPNKE